MSVAVSITSRKSVSAHMDALAEEDDSQQVGSLDSAFNEAPDTPWTRTGVRFQPHATSNDGAKPAQPRLEDLVSETPAPSVHHIVAYLDPKCPSCAALLEYARPITGRMRVRWIHDIPAAEWQPWMAGVPVVIDPVEKVAHQGANAFHFVQRQLEPESTAEPELRAPRAQSFRTNCEASVKDVCTTECFFESRAKVSDASRNAYLVQRRSSFPHSVQSPPAVHAKE